METSFINNGPMLNAYPDSMGGTLADIVRILKKPELAHVFQSFYILPSIFNTDLDRGFSVIDYDLNRMLADRTDLEELKQLGIHLKLDFVLNHISVLSRQFQDIIEHGEESKYRNFFIDWNEFWKDHGIMTEKHYIEPDPELIRNMFFRKPGLPILMVRFPDGKDVPYWNTFYQEIKYREPDVQELINHLKIQYGEAVSLAAHIHQGLTNEGKIPEQLELGALACYKKQVVEMLEASRTYLGQMDLNIKSPLVWEYYDETLKTLADYGAEIIRLDAFAYAPKEPGEKNFLNEPGTWDLLGKIQRLAEQYHLNLLPEIHSSYQEGIYAVLAEKGYMTYDFFLPGLIIDALEEMDGTILAEWATELYTRNIRTVNMLGCHDGIPLLDLKGLIPDERIERLIELIVERGGYVKNLHGQKNMYYQVNATYYSTLGEKDHKLLAARALQLFMPGKPQIWYLDLFAGCNDYNAMMQAGTGGHKEINRTNLSSEVIEEQLQKDVVKKQIEMIRFRSSFPAFGFDSKMEIRSQNEEICFSWVKNGYRATLNMNLRNCEFDITGIDNKGNVIWKN